MTTAPGRPRTVPADERAARDWYEHGLGWPTAGGPPLELLTGVRFDVLELPAAAGLAVLRRVPDTGPVALHGTRMRLLVAPGSAQELPELLRWLEWGGVPLGLSALGARWSRPCPRRRCAAGHGPGAPVRPPPISYGSWARRRRSATGPGCCAAGVSRSPSRRPPARWRGHGRGR